MHRLGLCAVTVTLSVTAAQVMSPSEGERQGRRFEVVSVRLIPNGTRFRPGGSHSPGRYVEQDVTLRDLIAKAYSSDGNASLFGRFGLTGGPTSILSKRFHIEARMNAEAEFPAIQEMIRTLLSERFKLRAHREQRLVPAYAVSLVHVGRLGSELRLSSIDCQKFVREGGTFRDSNRPRSADGHDVCFDTYDFARMRRENVMALRGAGTITEILSYVQGLVDRRLVDRSGLTGNFEWALTCAPTMDSDSPAPSVYTALRNQLGLKVQSIKIGGEVVVIDSVEMPTPD